MSVAFGRKPARILSSLIGVLDSVVYIYLGFRSKWYPDYTVAISFEVRRHTFCFIFSQLAKCLTSSRDGGFFSITGIFSQVGMMKSKAIIKFEN